MLHIVTKKGKGYIPAEKSKDKFHGVEKFDVISGNPIKNKSKINKSVSLVVSKVGSGIAVMFADNPNFRGAWYGTNRLFLNAIFLGDKIDIP